MMKAFKKKSRGATLPEYAIVVGIMALAAVGARSALWEAGKQESAQQEACISQVPPPAFNSNGSGCEIPAVSTTVPSGPPPPTTTTTTTTTLAPTQPSAPQNIVVQPTYDATGTHFLDVTFTPPANISQVPIENYQYSTNNGVNWKIRSAGTTETSLRIDIPSNQFNGSLKGGTEYNVAIRAIAQGSQIEGKRSEIWRVGTAKSVVECAPSNYCPENFEARQGTVGGVTGFYGTHRLAATDLWFSGKAFFTNPTAISLLVIGGGGGGGSNGGGGGGGGGFYAADVTVNRSTGPESFYWVVAGAGGQPGSGGAVRGNTGFSSGFGGITVYGGGGGASRDGGDPTLTFSSRGAWDAPGGVWASLVTPSIASGGGGANTTTGYRRAGGNGNTTLTQGKNAGWGCSNNGGDCLGEGGGGGGGGAQGAGTAGNFNLTNRGGIGGTGRSSTRETLGTSIPYGTGGSGGKTVNGNAGPGVNCSSSAFNDCVGGSSQPTRRASGMDGRGGGGAGGSGGTNGRAAGRGGGGVVFFSYPLINSRVSLAET